MTDETDGLSRSVSRLNRRVANLELFTVAVLIGIGIYAVKSAATWFAIPPTEVIFFGIALAACTLTLFARHRVVELLKFARIRKSAAQVIVTSCAVLSVAYMIPALITALRING